LSFSSMWTRGSATRPWWTTPGYPGMILVATDSHTTTHGAFGAFGTGVGATDMAVIMITGKLWFRVPEIIRFHLTGALPKGVFAKDVILRIIGDLGADYGIYKGIEFTGPVLKSFNVSERMALCNMTTEIGAKTAYIQPDEITLDFVRIRVKHNFQVFTSDPGYKYAAEHTYEVSRLKPQLAAPHSVDNVHPLEKFIGTPIHQAFLGTCTGGRGRPGHRRENPEGEKSSPGNPFHRGPRFQGRSPGSHGQGIHADSGRSRSHLCDPRVRRLSGDPRGNPGSGRDLHHRLQPEFPGPHGFQQGADLRGLARLGSRRRPGRQNCRSDRIPGLRGKNMEKIVKGKAFIFGANIDTDQIYPGRYLELTDPKEVGKHALEGADPNLVKEFKPGDIIVASTNFGCGSSREQAAITLKAIGGRGDPGRFFCPHLLPQRHQPGDSPSGLSQNP